MRRILIVLMLLWIASPTLAGAAAKKKPGPESSAQEVAEARELLDAGRPERALALLKTYLKDHPKNAEALLLRSTARLMLGEDEEGRADLERALKLDPSLREGWLNLGAVAIADKRYDDAVNAFLEAEKLAPEAPENDLNIGAVMLLAGKLGPASERFERYLTPDGSGKPGAEDYYLVATNYALAGYAALALEHLKRAIEGDEKIRRQARVEPNFFGLRGHPQFQQLLDSDSYQPPPGAYSAAQTFAVPYDVGDGLLLKAVLDTLQLSRVPFDPNVEVTGRWALIWGEVRIKVTNDPDGKGQVQVSAPATDLSPAQWRARVDPLFRGIEERLILSGVLPPEEPPR